MEYRQLGRTDLQVSSIGLGCVTFDREIDEETAFTVMDHAIACGINLFDTAEAYASGGSEKVVGRWLSTRGVRSQIVLATKVSGSLTRHRILASADASLKRLQSDVIDLFQVHPWDGDIPLEETLDALDTLVAQGKVRYAGCSNYLAWQMREALRQQESHQWARMESVQPNYNLSERSIEAELLPLCAEQQIGVISYSPLGAGFLTGKYRQGAPMPEGTRFDIKPAHRDIYFTAEKWRIVEELRARSERTGLSMVHLALAWVIGQPGITSVLIGARTPEQVDQAFSAEENGLSDELRAALSAL